MINLNFNQSNSTPNNCTFHTRQLDETIVGTVTNNSDSPANSMSASPPPAPPPVPPLNPSCARCRHTSTATLQRQSQVIGSNPHLHASLSHQNSNYGIPTTNSYSGFDGSTRLIEEEDSACPALLEQDFNRYQRSVPGLRRSGVDANAIRQHFYPDGDWGWIVCSVAFLAHILTTGFQLSYGFLLLYAIKHLGQESAMEAGWLGAGSWAMSLFSASIVIALCRRKSTRLVAVLGGLVIALGVLFASFATLVHQVAISYCIVVGFGASLVRDSAALMIGHYFKRRRQFVEMIVMAGEGVGVALFSVILKEGVGKIGWRLGLQAVTALLSLSFFMGLLYRPASLYHPQRRAILHLKNSRKKVKEKKTHIQTPKPPFMDFSPLRSSTVRMLCILAAVGAFGIYTPVFFLSIYGYQSGYDMQDLVLLQTFLGLSLAVGIVASGSSINKTCQIAFKKFRISRQYVCQGCVILVSISIVILSMLSSDGYHTLCIVTWVYGLGLGGYRYSLKMLALERVKGKFFTRAWGFIKGAESIPVLISIPLTGFLNEASLSYGKAGYYICSAATAISAVLMFFIGYPDGGRQNTTTKLSTNGSISSRYNGVSVDGNSSFRCNTQYYPAQYPVATQECPTATPHYHYPPQYNQQQPLPQQQQQQQQQQYPVGNGTPANYYHGYNARPNGSAAGGHGRLQKSLSFAFQTPTMVNEMYNANHHGCHNQVNQNNYPTERCYSRCDMYNQPHQHPHHQHSQQHQQQNHQQQSVPSHLMNGGLQNASRSRSVPDFSAYPTNNDCHWNYNRTIGPSFYRTQSRQPIQVLEQITTSV